MTTRKTVASASIALLLVTAPGLDFYQALGQVFNAPEPAEVPASPAAPLPAAGPSGSFQGLDALSALPAAVLSAAPLAMGALPAARESASRWRSGARVGASLSVRPFVARSLAFRRGLPSILAAAAARLRGGETRRKTFADFLFDGQGSVAAGLAAREPDPAPAPEEHPAEPFGEQAPLRTTVGRRPAGPLDGKWSPQRAVGIRPLILGRISVLGWKVNGREAKKVGYGSFKEVVLHPDNPAWVVKIFSPLTGFKDSLQEQRRELSHIQAWEGLGIVPPLITEGSSGYVSPAEHSARAYFIVQERVSGFDLRVMTPDKLQAATELLATLASHRILLADLARLRQNIMYGPTASRPEPQAYLVDAGDVEENTARSPEEIWAVYEGILSSWAMELGLPTPVPRLPEAKTAVSPLGAGLALVSAALGLAASVAFCGVLGLVGPLLAAGTYWLAERWGWGMSRASSAWLAAGVWLAAEALTALLIHGSWAAAAGSAGFALMGGLTMSADWTRAFLAAIEHPVQPGEVFRVLPKQERSPQFEKLIQDGQSLGGLLRFNDQDYLFTVAPVNGNKLEHRAADRVAEAIQVWAKDDVVKTLQAAHEAARLLDNIPKAQRSNAYNDYWLLSQFVLQNIASWVLQSYLGSYDATSLAKAEQSPDVLHVRQDVKGAIEFLQSAVYALNLPTPKASISQIQTMRLVLAELRKINLFWAGKRLEPESGKQLLGFLNVYVNELEKESAQAQGGQAASGNPSQGPSNVSSALAVKTYSLDKSKFPVLTNFADNLTLAAAEGRLNPLIGRREELRKVTQTLIRWTKANPALIGPAGIGKTAIVEGLAQAIISGEIPELAGTVILQLDLGALVAGTKYRGEFEERIKGVIKEASELKGKMILFVDEMHVLLGLGSAEGSSDLANIIKPALSRNAIRMIGATTLEEYRKVEKDKALKRRFRPIPIEPSSPEESVAILRGLVPHMEEHHHVSYEPDALQAAVDLSERYITDRHLPDKAIDILDEAGSKVRLAKGPAVASEDVAQVVSEWTGIPVAKLNEQESERLLRLPQRMNARVVNQDEAVGAIAAAVIENHAGIGEDNKTMGSFLLAGPTGVGKTHIARSLAIELFGSENNMVRLDGSDYSEKHSASRLIGSPPGYVGYDDAGQLTEAVRRKPYCVVLFDEIEEADPSVQKLFLQIMEDGFLNDTHGNRVDFRNTVVIFTTNIGGQLAGDKKVGIGFGAQEPGRAGVRKDVLEKIKKAFEPKFYNRLSGTFVLNSLSKQDVARILDKETGYLEGRLARKGLSVTVSPEARQLILDQGFDPVLGARPLKRALKTFLESPIALGIVSGEFKPGDRLKAERVGEGVVVKKDASASPSASPQGPPNPPSSPNPPQAAAFILANLALVAPHAAVVTAGAFLPALIALGAVLAWTLRRDVAGLLPRLMHAIPGLKPGLAAPQKMQSPFKTWLPKVALWTLGLAALDWTTKLLAFRALPSFVFHYVGGRVPFLTFAVPLGVLLLLYARRGLGQVDALAEKHPSLKPALAFYDVALAMGLAGVIGNGLEAILFGRVADFIPIGGATANIADLLLFFGLSHHFIAADFFDSARRADLNDQPITLPFWKYFALPLLAIFGAFLTFSKGMPLLSAYALIYGIMIGLGVLVSSYIVTGQVRDFNQSYHESASPALRGNNTAFGWPWRLKLRLLSLLAGLGFGIAAQQALAMVMDRLKAFPPKLVITDYDDTFEDNNKGGFGVEISDAKIALLNDLRRQGIKVAFATNRPWDLLGRNGQSIGISHLLGDRLTAEERRGMPIAADGGAAVYQFSKEGEKPARPAIREPGFSKTEQEDLALLLSPVLDKLGLETGLDKMGRETGVEKDVRLDIRDHHAALVLEKQRGKAEALLRAVKKLLKKAKLAYDAQLKYPNNPANAPYILISDVDKGDSVRGILKLLESEGERIQPSEVLILGDDFDKPGADAAMARALPGATAISVGKKVAPGLPVYLYPGEAPGSEKTERILRELAPLPPAPSAGIPPPVKISWRDIRPMEAFA